MKFFINDTSSYHENDIHTLGWEVTVANSLEPGGSPARKILYKNTTFGCLLADHLSRFIPLDKLSRVIEIGGGYGYLMRDLLSRFGNLNPVMMDISAVLLERQKENLAGFDAEFVNLNFFDTERTYLVQFDLAVLNEIAGDLPTACNVPRPEKTNRKETNQELNDIYSAIDIYNLAIPDGDCFTINIGAIQALDMLCSSGIPYIYISEHSCEADMPDFFMETVSRKIKTPERIGLNGHDEFTVRFSHLEKVAEFFGYTVIRGQYRDFMEIENSDRLRYICSTNTLNEEHEIIRQFLYDIYKYEYLVLIRGNDNK